MASTGQERTQTIKVQLCAGGLLHPKQDPPGEHPCMLCSAMADLLFGEGSVALQLARINNQLSTFRR